MRAEERRYEDSLDMAYSYQLAKRLETYKTNPCLGYRTAGSEAEHLTGDMLAEEMREIGLQNVRKEEITVDSWDFHHCIMRYRDKDGVLHECQLGAYQTNFQTEGWQTFPVVFAGKGTAADYEGLDVSGKLVMAQINQRDEWWISFPVYQAYIRGAAAFIAVQEGGYGEIDDTALNAQDIGGPEYAPAFSMSRADAALLRERLAGEGEVTVELSARSVVRRDCRSYNILGEIPGREKDSMILLSAHYDSYFSGFQDDNAAIALMLGIGRALVRSGYRPQKTIVFCAMAAEEWGITDSKYDWSTGAWQQVSRVHPEWQGKVIADLNFELPAHAHGAADGVRTVYEYEDFMKRFVEGLELEDAGAVFPEGIRVLCPVETMSDDFSMAISGIPSMVNDFTAGQFMETHYHSQFDNDDVYDEAVFAFHHRMYGRLVMAFDRLAAAPLDFGRVFKALRDCADLEFSQAKGAEGMKLWQQAGEAMELGQRIYGRIREMNEQYAAFLDEGREKEAAALREKARKKEQLLLQAFRKEQDHFVRLDWHDQVLFPHQGVRENLIHLEKAIASLEKGEVRQALEAIYQIDNNRYAFEFDQEVFDHFTDSVMNQAPERLQWGAGRIIHHENLFELVASLKEKARRMEAWRQDAAGHLCEDFAGDEARNLCEDVSVGAAGNLRIDFSGEIAALKQVEAAQTACYIDDIAYMLHGTETVMQILMETEED